MSVANPCMEGSPAPVMSHSVSGLPGLQFSASIAFAGPGGVVQLAKAAEESDTHKSMLPNKQTSRTTICIDRPRESLDLQGPKSIHNQDSAEPQIDKCPRLNNVAISKCGRSVEERATVSVSRRGDS